jgi:hypothetical protein
VPGAATPTAVSQTHEPGKTADSSEDSGAASGSTGTPSSGDRDSGGSQTGGGGANQTPTPGSNGTGSAPGASPTPAPDRQLTLSVPASIRKGETASVPVRLTGDATQVAAFNFDIVYDQTVVSIAAPDPDLEALDTEERSFQCNLPPASGDVDPDSKVGRARLVCFSFGGASVSAPTSPTTLATLQVTGLKTGTTELTFENVAFFKPDATAVTVAAPPVSVEIK